MSLPNLQGTNVYLIGMMGSGKSTIGAILADRLSHQFFDTDALIEQVSGRSVTELFEQSGENAFRKLETQVLRELSGYLRKLIATGGGIVVTPENWGHLRSGIIIWLDVPVEVLSARLANDTTRPLLKGDLDSKLNDLFADRSALYSQADLHIKIAGHETPEEICHRILVDLNAALVAKAEENASILKLNQIQPFRVQ
jgi:shikimate kinase